MILVWDRGCEEKILVLGVGFGEARGTIYKSSFSTMNGSLAGLGQG